MWLKIRAKGVLPRPEKNEEIYGGGIPHCTVWSSGWLFTVSTGYSSGRVFCFKARDTPGRLTICKSTSLFHHGHILS